MLITHCNPSCQESDSKACGMNKSAMTIVAAMIISSGFAACSDTEEEPQVTESWEVTALLTTTGQQILWGSLERCHPVAGFHSLQRR